MAPMIAADDNESTTITARWIDEDNAVGLGYDPATPAYHYGTWVIQRDGEWIADLPDTIYDYDSEAALEYAAQIVKVPGPWTKRSDNYGTAYIASRP